MTGDLDARVERGCRVAPEVEPVLRSWKLLAQQGHALADFGDKGALDADLASPKVKPFSVALQGVYAVSRRGVSLFEGVLAVHSFPPESVQKYGLEIPEGLELPEGLAVFGSSDEMVWATLPRHDAPVFAIREHDVKDIVVAATSVAAFLRVETANALLLLSGWGPAHDPALDALGAPAAVRRQMADDDVFARIIAWADPDATERRIYYDREPLGASALRAYA